MSEGILEETVIKGGYCIGCGICASLKDSSMEIKLNKDLIYQASINKQKHNETLSSVEEVCPFSNESLNEDEIGKELFGSSSNYNDKLGYFIETYAGYVEQGAMRDNGSSGGMGTWILSELLEANLIDKVIHVKPVDTTSKDNMLFKYSVSSTAEEVLAGAKSRYYPIELSEVLNQVRNEEGRYAIVGLPCFIKSVRLLARKDTTIDKRLKFYIGLVCGHLKSANFANMFSLQLGVKPKQMRSINFREKLDNFGANHYGVSIKHINKGEELTTISPPINKLYGANWGWGLFKYKACDYCDDVVAETADITIGDAWLPKYVNDSKGTNIVVVRNATIKKLLDKAIKQKRLVMDVLTPNEIIQSQESGFRHRRDSLAYRLYLKDKKGDWRPQKRVKPSNDTIDEKTKAIQNLRMEIAAKSHIAFRKAVEVNDFNFFKQEMSGVITRYKSYYKVSFFKKILYHIKKLVK